MTPKEYDIHADAFHFKEDNRIKLIRWQTWNTAMLPHFKKRPELNEFVKGDKAEQTKQSPEEQLHVAQRLNVLLGGKDLNSIESYRIGKKVWQKLRSAQ